MTTKPSKFSPDSPKRATSNSAKSHSASSRLGQPGTRRDGQRRVSTAAELLWRRLRLDGVVGAAAARACPSSLLKQVPGGSLIERRIVMRHGRVIPDLGGHRSCDIRGNCAPT